MAERDPDRTGRSGVLGWLGHHELGFLLLVLCAAGCTWVFVSIADRVTAGETADFDARLLLALRSAQDTSDPVGPAWVEELGRDMTALGGTGVLTLLALAVTGFLVLQGRPRTALLLVAAVVGGLLMSTALKLGFDRPRPDLVPHASHVSTSSFPSGHSMMSAVTYLTLGALLARVQPRARLRSYVLLLALLLTVLVGISRVYVGVHWPTDVLAGWTAGAAWAAFCWAVARGLQRRGHVEAEPPAA